MNPDATPARNFRGVGRAGYNPIAFGAQPGAAACPA